MTLLMAACQALLFDVEMYLVLFIVNAPLERTIEWPIKRQTNGTSM